jgi:hypothetical protein
MMTQPLMRVEQSSAVVAMASLLLVSRGVS